ncbi:MAG: hypothetical protein GTN76_09250 [Candidatus Aenigmarchaeota archaeon]|nr:hypothetical protein [Candidatus Aenigmarchaeota archaeon]
MAILKNELLKDLTPEERLEVTTRAFCELVKDLASMIVRMEKVMEQLELTVFKERINRWEKALHERLEERRKNGTST